MGERALRGAAGDGARAGVATAGRRRGEALSATAARPGRSAPRQLRLGRPPGSAHRVCARAYSAVGTSAICLDATRRRSGAFVVRPAPEDEAAVAVEAVRACLAAGRRALVIVPEAAPMPATAAALRGGVRGPRRVFVGRGRAGPVPDVARRSAAGRFDVVVGTRPAVFAPVTRPRADRASRANRTPRIARTARPTTTSGTSRSRRAQLAGAVCVLVGALPFVGGGGARRSPSVAPASGGGRRWRWSVPGPEGRAPRLVRALREAQRAFVFSPLPGLRRGAGLPRLRRPGGVRRLRRHAARSEEGRCGASSARRPGGARACGGVGFGIRRGGAERVEEWAAACAAGAGRARRSRPRLPRRRARSSSAGRRTCGTSAPAASTSSRSSMPTSRTRARGSPRANARWRPGWRRSAGRARAAGRSSRPHASTIPRCRRSCAATPIGSTRDERARRAAAGFPVGAAVFRVVGTPRSTGELADVRPDHARCSRRSGGGRYACSRSSPAASPRSGAHARPRRRGRGRARRSRTAPVIDRSADAVSDPHPGRPGAARAGQAREHVRPCAARARQGHDRDDVRGPRRGARRPAGGDLAAAVRVRRRRARSAGSWRTPSCSTPRARSPEEEGCLSIPGPYHPTSRSRRIRAEGSTSTGSLSSCRRGLLARIFQHETDHLGGMLYIDRLDDDGRKAVLAELRRIELGLVEPRGRRRMIGRGYPAAVTVRVAFLGNDPWSVPALDAIAGEPDLAVALVVTNPPKAAGRGDTLRADRVADAARRSALPLVEADGVRAAAGAERARGGAPDAIVVVAYGELLAARRLDHAPLRRGEPAFLAVASMARRLARPACDPGRRHGPA